MKRCHCPACRMQELSYRLTCKPGKPAKVVKSLRELDVIFRKCKKDDKKIKFL